MKHAPNLTEPVEFGRHALVRGKHLHEFSNRELAVAALLFRDHCVHLERLGLEGSLGAAPLAGGVDGLKRLHADEEAALVAKSTAEGVQAKHRAHKVPLLTLVLGQTDGQR
jgi:hypothetical protein